MGVIIATETYQDQKYLVAPEEIENRVIIAAEWLKITPYIFIMRAIEGGLEEVEMAMQEEE